MESGNTKRKENIPSILSWIMLIFGVLLILPGGYFFVIFLPFLFSRALESTEAGLVLGLVCISGFVFIIGILL
jgi:hypothetical protein